MFPAEPARACRLRPSVSGDNTFLVPLPSDSSSSAEFNGGIIGTNSALQGLTSAQIGGIVGGILGAFFLIALILLCCCMRRGPLFGMMGSRSDKGTHTSSHSSSHGHSHGLGTAAAAGGLSYFLGRRARRSSSGSHAVHSSSGQHHVGRKAGLSALLGSAAGGLATLFAGRQRSNRMSEKYSTTDISSGYYTSDVTSNSYTATSSSDSSSSSSSESSSSSGHPHHGRH